MTMIACTIALLLSIGVPASVAFNCTGQRDGLYEVGCHVFTKCTSGSATRVECQRPEVVNVQTGNCDSPLNVREPCGTYRDCAGKDDGKYPDMERHCQYYYTCANGRFMGHNPCPTDLRLQGSSVTWNPTVDITSLIHTFNCSTIGLIFNEEMQVCDWFQNVKSPCGIRPGST